MFQLVSKHQRKHFADSSRERKDLEVFDVNDDLNLRVEVCDETYRT